MDKSKKTATLQNNGYHSELMRIITIWEENLEYKNDTIV
jgi:hypothetical protein